MPTRTVPPQAISLIRASEGCVLTAYRDPASVWTIGYGHTGPEVKEGLVWNQNQAEAALVADADHAANELSDCITEYALLKLTDHEYAALVDFTFNLGANHQWTIWSDISSGNIADVPRQIMRFDHATVGGKLVELPGLKTRRTAEVALWNTGDVDAASAVAAAQPTPSSGFVRTVSTPPAPETKPFALTSLMAKAGGGVAALGAAATQVQGIVQPHASEAPVFQHVAVVLTGVIIVASVIGLTISHKQAVVATR